MKTTNLIHLTIMLLMVWGCDLSSQSINCLNEIDYFSQVEKSDLNKISNYFASKICDEWKFESEVECYNKVFRRFKENPKFDFSILGIEYVDFKKFYSSEIEESTLDLIWSETKLINYELNDSTESVTLNYSGKFSQFLKKVGERNDLLKGYYEQLISVGAISPAMIAQMQMNYDLLNFENCNDRLIVAIHYLTLLTEYGIRIDFQE